jgi:hypothetical protein
MPRSLVEQTSIKEAQELFGVTFEAARARSNEMKNA